MADSNKSILLVEDDASARDLYKEVLTDAGYAVDTAPNGEDGLRKAQEGGYAIIFLDVMLPKMDGLAILSSLKKTPPKQNNGPIFLLTNLAHDPVIQEAKTLGAKGHITKSDINPGELVEKVKKILG